MLPASASYQARPSADPLALLGISPSQSAIIRYFALRPNTTIHGRELQRLLGLGTASIRRGLEALVTLGALDRYSDRRYVFFKANLASSLWQAFRAIIASTSDPSSLIRDALRNVAGIEAAFVFGSTANDTRGKDSDIDVFLVQGPHLDRRALFGQLAEVGLLLGTEVSPILYTTQLLAERLGVADHAAARFARDVLEGPKRWVAGDPEVLRPLITAAGLRFAA